MRDRHGNEISIRFSWYWDDILRWPCRYDRWLDGGSVSYVFGPLTIHCWIGHP